MSDFPWSIGVFDAHCHPTDTITSLADIPSMRARVLTVMATRSQDQQLVFESAQKYGITEAEIRDEGTDWSSQHRIIPAFGWHPWFSMQMFFPDDYDGTTTLARQDKIRHYKSVLTPEPDDDFLSSLPEPASFDHFITQTRRYMQSHPLALLGEVGLDKAFRLPVQEQATSRNDDLTPGGREGRKLSQFRVSMEHQRRVLKIQLRLAGELNRAASIHGVQAHGILFDTLSEMWKGYEHRTASKREKKRAALAGLDDAGVADNEQDVAASHRLRPFPPRICLHSFSGPAETVKQYLAPSIPCDVFFSFSVTVNAWSELGNGKVEAALKTVPDDKILIESDLHTAGNQMDEYLEQAARKICAVKGWNLHDGVKQLAQNWKHFVTGTA